MLTTALSQIKENYRRFIAVCLALAIAVGFVQATLIFNNLIQDTMVHVVASDLAKADIIVTAKRQEDEESSPATWITEDDVEKVKQTPGVTGVGENANSYVIFSKSKDYVKATSLAPEALRTTDLKEGRYPQNNQEITVDTKTATERKIKLNQTIDIDYFLRGLKETETTPIKTEQFTVVGFENSKDILGEGRILAPLDVIERFKEGKKDPDSLSIKAPQQNLPELVATLKKSLGENFKVVTKSDFITNEINSISKSIMVVISLLLGFVAIALAVAAMVVANTFTVLLAQRTRELGLLRCIGAKGKQIKNSVLIEATIVGFISALIGIAISLLGMRLVVSFAQAHDWIPRGFDAYLTFKQVALGCVLGILLSTLAAYLPAHKAMKVSPMEALNPLQEARLENKQGKIKLSLGFFLLVTGTLVLVWGAKEKDLSLAFCGGIVSFLGVILTSSLFIPPTIGFIGKLFFQRSVVQKLASLNSVRNPRRTASTATALLIGVTLVSSIVTAASIARTSVADKMSENFPLDIIASTSSRTASFTPEDFQKVKQISGIQAVAQATEVKLKINGKVNNFAYAVDPEEFSAVTRSSQLAAKKGEILIRQGSNYGPTVKVSGASGELTLKTREIKWGNFTPFGSLISDEDAHTLDANTTAQNILIAKTNADVDTKQALDLQKKITNELQLPAESITGALKEKAAIETIINTMLTIIVGLLAIAILIAMVGVSNTISLSVIERTRESSMLRALGLTKNQLRSMLATEALLITGVAALLAIIGGILYGIAGACAALGGISSLNISIPWLELGIIFLIATGTGLAATIIPGRKAAKLSPVEGLAHK